MKRLFFLFISTTLISCAKLPVQSVTLMQEIKTEGERMHRLNEAYVNKMFNEKMVDINDFIQNEYTPALIKETQELIQKKIAAGEAIDMNKEWPTVLQKMNPRISAVKDSLTRTLEENRRKIMSKMSADYQVYQQACEAQLNFLNSAVKVNEASRQSANAIIQKFTKNKMDLNRLQDLLDKYIQKGGTAAQMMLTLQSGIDNLLQTN